jgi:hypothetical protein
MSLLLWALIQIAYLVAICALIAASRVLLEALSLFHAAGLARVHNHTRENHR